MPGVALVSPSGLSYTAGFCTSKSISIELHCRVLY